MDKIYSNAKNVAIYLGYPTERTQPGMEALRSFIDPDVKFDNSALVPTNMDRPGVCSSPAHDAPPHFGSYGGPSELDWTPLLQILEAQMRQVVKREGATNQRSQLNLAFDFRNRLSTDARDKYYAIFSIVENDNGGPLALAPEYNAGVKVLHRKFITEMQRLSEANEASDAWVMEKSYGSTADKVVIRRALGTRCDHDFS
ncbi:hypothetical protein BU23DRAFT_565758 [Bimuria novae-zelandiae CBS 107.79]|uniref:Heterokaryon incompatibility domain-containing protein n=1 Tax=Bimuria novae-zelandiae CBS 107.79 TaxID=1447943 RepID=A0A6A5VNW0_9PLEO|nr:hypothetical protein BU23DRAFT_565758 [Bimuria novae-zelandiae CBS 107.79]